MSSSSAKLGLKILTFALLAPLCGQVKAAPALKSSGLIVNAEQMNTDFQTKTTVLKGNVQVVFQGQHLSADKALIDYRGKTIEASGHVRLQGATVYAEASSLSLDYESNTAILKDAFLQSGQVVFEGKEIRKTGPETYVATEANYTACVSCPPTWSFSGREIEAELGGYARIKRPVMRVGGVPVMILPAIMVPLKSSRQSGVLVPSLDYSREGGLALSESYFWAIDRSKDMTFTGKYYELRGVKGLAQYRYVLSENSSGQFEGAYIGDRAFRHNYQLGDDSRWNVQYQHIYNLPGSFIQRVDLKQISDLRYVRDFPDEVGGHGDPALGNNASITKNSGGQHASILANYNINLLRSWPMAHNDDAVHRFPEIQYSIIEKRIFNSPFLFRFDATYTAFSRADFGYDDFYGASHTPPIGIPNPNCVLVNIDNCPYEDSQGAIARDGQFDPNFDRIRTGQRLDIKPSLSMPLKVGRIFELVPRVTYRDIQYVFPVDEGGDYSSRASQKYLEMEVAARTTMSHVYGNLSSPNSERIKHEFEPQLTFATIPMLKRPGHDFFGDFDDQRYSRIYEPITDYDIGGTNGLQFDYNDRMFNKRIGEFALTNRLIRKRWRGGIPEYVRIATFRLSESYDFFEANRRVANNKNRTPQPFSPIDALLNVRLDHFETYTTASINPYARVANTSSRLKFMSSVGNFLQVSLDRSYLVNENNEIVNANYTRNYGLGGGFRTKYIDLEGQVDKVIGTDKVVSWQYVANVKPPGNCWIIRVGHKQIIGGAGPEFRFNMVFDFGGEKISKLN